MRLLPITLLTAASVFGQSHPSWWTLADPDATALVGIQWENLSRTPFAGAVQAEISAGGSLGFPDIPMIATARQILISSPALLAIANGNFPAAVLRTQALSKGLKPTSYHGVDLWISPGRSTLSVARLTDQILLIGLHRTLEDAIDRSQSDTARHYSPLLAPAARLAQGKDLWVMAAQLPDPLASLFVPIDAEAQKFEGALSVRDGLELHATFDAASDAGALAIAEGLRDSIPALPAIAKALEVSVDGHTVELAISVNAEQLNSTLHPTGAVAAPVPPTVEPVKPQPEPKPEGPQVVRIYGLDDGPREIILKPKNQEL